MTDDLIGRAEAQTAIQFAARRYTVAHEAHGEGQVVWSDNLINVTDAMNVLRDLPSVQPEQRWVLCSERLPEDYGEFLVTYKSDGEQIFMDIIEYEPSYEFDHEKNRFKGNWLFADDLQAVNSEVIAWMPLPEPYQAERREDEAD